MYEIELPILSSIFTSRSSRQTVEKLVGLAPIAIMTHSIRLQSLTQDFGTSLTDISLSVIREIEEPLPHCTCTYFSDKVLDQSGCALTQFGMFLLISRDR
jgi:hypothetical protein